MQVTTDPPADQGGADDPNAVRVYFDNVRQPDLLTGQTVAVFDTFVAGGAPAPTSNAGPGGFAAISSPGSVYTGDGSIVNFSGDNSGNVGYYGWNSSGKPTKGLPCCSASANTIQNMLASTETTMIYNLTDFDTDGMAVNRATGFITCQTAGIYLCTYLASYASATGGSRITLCYKNSTSVRRWGHTVGETIGATVTHALRLAVGDTVSFRQYQSSGATLGTAQTLAYYPQLQVMMVGV